MLKTKVSIDRTVGQSKGFIVSDMNGEKVMMSVQNGKYYNLGEIGGLIWEKIQSPTTVSNLINLLILEYNVEHSDCKNQVIDFLDNLHVEGLIELLD
jgi:hypothetical protein